MAADFCPGCGVEHHWLACPETRQSVFPHDPEWEAEEPAPPMVASYSLWGFSTADPDWRPTRGLVGPRWDPANPE